MSKLEELIQELCPDGVEYKKIGDFCSVYDGTHQTPKYTDTGVKFASVENIADLYATQKYISEDDFKKFKIVPQIGDVIMTRIGSIGICTVIDRNEPLAYYVSLALIRPDLNKVDSTYLKYAIESINGQRELRKRTLTHAVPIKINTGEINKVEVPVPPLEVQREIVRVLDHFTLLRQELSAELSVRRKQYEYYRDELLTFGDDVEWKELQEIFDIVDYRGKTPKKSDEGVFLVTAKNIRKGYIDYGASQEFIPYDTYEDVMHRGKPKIGDLLITTEAPCGYVALVDRDDVALAQRVIKYRAKDDNVIDMVFAKHYLLGTAFQAELERKATGGTVKGIKGSKLHMMKMPVPSIDVQKNIAKILSDFDTLIHDIEGGLPAEINGRQIQYEYYRDKLLSFKRKEAMS